MEQFRILPVKLDKAELEKKALELADTCAKRNDKDEERREAAHAFGSELKTLDKDIDRLVKVVQTGTEEREVKCDTRRNNKNKTIETIRLDTGEVVDTREMNEHELNGDLFDQDPQKPAPKRRKKRN